VRLLLVLLLSGCAVQPKLPEVVKVPVPVPCIDQIPAAPELAQDDAVLAMGDYEAVLTMWRDRLSARVAYDELRAIAEACVK
jgi:hypothetical protein